MTEVPARLGEGKPAWRDNLVTAWSPNGETDPVLRNVLASLAEFTTQCQFDEGVALRLKGQHYSDAFLIIEGEVGVSGHDPANPSHIIRRGPGDTIGEIGFLHGTSANADVLALAPVTAFRIDDAAMRRLQHGSAEVGVWLLQRLAQHASARRSVNLTPAGLSGAGDAPIEVQLCRDASQKREAQRLRYRVYCGEHGRTSTHADHEAGLLKDRLDDFAHIFLAKSGDEVIGTLRLNFAREGELGVLETLYGMHDSAHHPHDTGICTKFVVHPDWRGSPVALKLIGAAARFGVRQGGRECYIDAIPALMHYYRAMGFVVTNDCFLHEENGPSVPMRLDLRRHGRRLSREFSRLQFVRLYLASRVYKTLKRFSRPDNTSPVEAELSRV